MWYYVISCDIILMYNEHLHITNILLHVWEISLIIFNVIIVGSTRCSLIITGISNRRMLYLRHIATQIRTSLPICWAQSSWHQVQWTRIMVNLSKVDTLWCLVDVHNPKHNSRAPSAAVWPMHARFSSNQTPVHVRWMHQANCYGDGEFLPDVFAFGWRSSQLFAAAVEFYLSAFVSVFGAEVTVTVRWPFPGGQLKRSWRTLTACPLNSFVLYRFCPKDYVVVTTLGVST